MKKKFLPLLGAMCFALMLGVTGCNTSKTNQDDAGTTSQSEAVTTTYTVAFEVDGARYKTFKIKEGEKITGTVTNPTKNGFVFVGWYEGETKVDLTTYVVTHNVTFTAKFEEDEVKEADLFVYVQVNGNYLTQEEAELLETRYKATQLDKSIKFNVINAKAAEFTEALGDDADVVVGGNTPLQDYTAHETGPLANAGTGHFASTNRKVLIMSTVNPSHLALAQDFYAFVVADYSDGHEEEIDLTVTVHGDTDVVTVLDDKDDVISMPTITVPDKKIFKGFALTADGEVVLNVAKDAVLKYDDVKQLVAEGKNTLDLYPIIKDAPVVEEDLVIYVQVNGNYLTQEEAELLETRYKATKPDNNIKFNIIEAKATAFTEALGDDADVVVGGNDPLKYYVAHETGPLVNAGTGHFESTNRKVLIMGTVNPSHLALAQDFYAFVAADYPAE